MSSVPSLSDKLAFVQKIITMYIYPLWLLFGVTGCFLNLILFSRRQLRTTSCSLCKYQFQARLYLTRDFYTDSDANSWYCLFLFTDFLAASIDHLMTLIVGIGPALYSLNNPNPQIQSLLFCKMRGYLFQICLMLSRWYIAFACIDRYAFTSGKVRLRRFANKRTAYHVIVIIIIIWSIICSHRLIFYEIKGNICGIVSSMGAALYHSAYVIIGGGILPTMIMIICACLIRQNLAHKEQRQKQLSTLQRRDNSIDQQVLKILLLQIICYIIFIIPQMGNLVFNTVSLTIPNRSEDHLAIEQFVSFIAECILYLFPVTSFYLYTLTLRTFRKELIKFFRSVCVPCVGNRIMPMGAGLTVSYRAGIQH